MHIEVGPINSDKVFSQVYNNMLAKKKNVDKSKTKSISQEELKELIHKEISELELKNVMEGLDKIAMASEILNKRVKLSINKEINRVIITIVEKDTNRVIKEIPCKELQNLAAHLKEAIGILFDKTA